MAQDLEVGLHHVLSDVDHYAEHLARRKLRRYQLAPARAIVDSVRRRLGLTFTVMFSRQAGKNELSAEVEAFLLTINQRRGGSIVKCAPTFRPQIVNSQLRLEEILNNPLTQKRWATSQGYITSVGRARIFFFSAAPDSNIVGATASLLLEVDEAQDVDEAKFDKDIAPMGASENATTVFYGTAWTEDTLLEKQRRENLRLEAADGIKRDFWVPYHVVGQENPAYLTYVDRQLAKNGRDNPLMKTQYLLETVASSGRLFSPAQISQVTGGPPRQLLPQPGYQYVAGIDIAGEDEESEDAVLRSAKPKKDSTTVTIAAVTWADVAGFELPFVRVVNHYWYTGRRHRELLPVLVQLLKAWDVVGATVDATGIGAGIASFLEGALGEQRIEKFVFGSSSKSDLGWELVSTVNSGRLKLYASDESPEYRECLWELEQATRQLMANNVIRWQVPEILGHDDFLISLALAAHAASTHRPRWATVQQKQGSDR